MRTVITFVAAAAIAFTFAMPLAAADMTLKEIGRAHV